MTKEQLHGRETTFGEVLKPDVYIDGRGGYEQKPINEALGKATESIRVYVTLPEISNVVRAITIGKDGVVTVEDIPQSSGMLNSDETAFIDGPRGYRRVTIRPGTMNQDEFAYQAPAVEVSGEKMTKEQNGPVVMPEAQMREDLKFAMKNDYAGWGSEELDLVVDPIAQGEMPKVADRATVKAVRDYARYQAEQFNDGEAQKTADHLQKWLGEHREWGIKVDSEQEDFKENYPA